MSRKVSRFAAAVADCDYTAVDYADDGDDHDEAFDAAPSVVGIFIKRYIIIIHARIRRRIL